MVWLYSSLVILCFILAGITRSIFEGIPYYDTVQLYFKSKKWQKFWSKELFESTKDRDKDGVTTKMEKWFPNDGGHWIKHGETLFLFLTGLFTVLLMYNIRNIINEKHLLIIVASLVILYQIRASTFEITLTILKNKK